MKLHINILCLLCLICSLTSLQAFVVKRVVEPDPIPESNTPVCNPAPMPFPVYPQQRPIPKEMPQPTYLQLDNRSQATIRPDFPFPERPKRPENPNDSSSPNHPDC